MMSKTLIAILATGAAFTLPLGLSAPAFAQVTDQTDQSEEDWRRSRKKRGNTDIYRDSNGRSTGFGNGLGDFEPVSPVERLPSESRRHLMRERAKAIAESDDGDLSDAEYIPSEAAQTDPALEAEEREAWEVLTTQQSGAGGDNPSSDPSSGGLNPVAVTGRDTGQSGSSTRGGSTASLQEIMDAIKAGRMGGDGGADETSQDPSQPQSGQDQLGQTSAQTEAGASPDSSTGSADSSGAQGDAGDAASAYPAATRAEEPISPLERVRRTRDERDASGTQRSASDYLGTSSPSPDEPSPDEKEDQ